MAEDLKIDGNREIEEALKEFEAKAKEEEAQKVVKAFKDSEPPKMVQSVIKYSGGMVKDEQQADYTLFVLVVIMFLFSLYFFFRGEPKTKMPINIMNIDQSKFIRP